MQSYNFELPEKLLFFISKEARYKVAYGGRGCVDGDTQISTPNGKIKIKDFKGGLIYSYFKGEKIITFACKPLKYEAENLYKVSTKSGKEIIVTANHKFLTCEGWKKTNQLQTDHDYLFCEVSDAISISDNQILTNSGIYLLKFEQDVQNYLKIILSYLYHCLQDYRLCDVRFLQAVKTYQDILPLLNDAPQHKSRGLTHEDGLDISYIYALTYQFYNHLQNLDVHQVQADRNYVSKENYIYEKFFELLSELYLIFQQFHEKNNPLWLIGKLSSLIRAFCNELNQDENLRKDFGILFSDVHDNSFNTPFAGCNHSLHNTTKEIVKSIKYYKNDIFYDLFVPFYNNYIGNDIVNHNSGKSWTAARCLLIKALEDKIRVLCTRQLQTSIKDSVHKLLSDSISEMGLSEQFDITKDAIRAENGSEFIFKGLQNNTNEIKSIEGINYCWVEEAQSVSNDSWDILIPTVRQEGSEIWVTFNPDREEDATYQRFVKNTPPDAIVELVNYYDNPWFPEVLKREMEYDKSVDYGKYEHVWLGKTVINTEAQVYNGKFELKEFQTPDNVTFYYGADWGFANDPTALVRCFIQDQCLYIDYESGGIGVEFEELPALFDKIPESRKWEIRADSARPETISYMTRQGFRTVACPKWKGSVEDGIEYIRSFRRIYVHPRCKHTYEEFKFYSYKTDKNTGDILPIVLDKNNHYMDGLRYALNPYIQKNISLLDVL